MKKWGLGKTIFIIGGMFAISFVNLLVISSLDKKFAHKKLIKKVLKILFFLINLGLILIVLTLFKEGAFLQIGISLLFGIIYFLYSVYSVDFYRAISDTYKNRRITLHTLNILLLFSTFILTKKFGALPSVLLTMDYIFSINLTILLKLIDKYATKTNVYHKYFVTRTNAYKNSPPNTKDLWIIIFLVTPFTFFAGFFIPVFLFAGLGMLYVTVGRYILSKIYYQEYD